MSGPSWLPGVIAGVVAGALVGGAGTYWHVRTVEEALQQRPPVAYINYGGAAVAAAQNGQGDALLSEIRTKAARLAEAGYIVLDSETLIDAPAGLKVPLMDYRGQQVSGQQTSDTDAAPESASDSSTDPDPQ